MNQPNLVSQFSSKFKIVSERIAGLPVADAFKDWFAMELNQLKLESDDIGLAMVNPKLRALNQLDHLVGQHVERLANASNEQSNEESVMTVSSKLPAFVLEMTEQHQFSIEPELLHEHDRCNEQFDPVSPTAKIVGYLRGLDPELTKSSSFLVGNDGKHLLDELGIDSENTQKLMAVLFQSRYRAVNVAMRDSTAPVTQILEFASGVSPRGFQWAQNNLATIYVESDLPELMIHKSKRIRNALMDESGESRGTLHCCAADVLSRECVLKTLENFDIGQPLVLVSEGPLLYFDESEMEQFFANMALVLKAHPRSRWITDFVTTQSLVDLLSTDSGVAKGVKSVFGLTRREVVAANPFESDDCVKKMLARFGLEVDSVSSLYSVFPTMQIAENLRPKAKQMVGQRKVWSITV